MVEETKGDVSEEVERIKINLESKKCDMWKKLFNPISILILILILVIIFSLYSIEALNVNLNNTNIIQVTYNINKNIPITLTNNGNFTLYNIEIVSNYTILQTNLSQLGVNQTLPVTLTINTNKIGNFIENIKFKGFRKKVCVGGDIVEVHINQFGMEPSDVKVCIGDSVKFINDYSQSIYLSLTEFIDTNKCLNNIGSYQLINSGSSFTTTPYNSLGLQSFGICNLLLNNFVSVDNNEILIHNKQDDITLSLNITSILSNTTLILDYISQINFTTNYDEIKTGSLIIKNTGSTNAVKINLSADWLLFNENLIDIPAGGTKSIDFSIYPDVFNSGDTNKTYFQNITIEAINSNILFQQLSIFVNYENTIASDGDLAYVIYLDNVFCPKHPFSFLCEQSPRIIIKEVPKYACPDIIAKLTPEDILNLLNDKTNAVRTAESAFNYMKIYAESTNQTIDQVLRGLNVTSSTCQDSKDAQNDTSNTMLIIYYSTIGITLTGMGTVVFYKYYRRKMKLKKHTDFNNLGKPGDKNNTK